MSKLNIYRLSGIENENQNQQFNIWTADTDTLTNTRAANFLLARINAMIANIQYSERVTAEQYNELDFYAVSLHALAIAHKDDSILRKCGYVLQAMVDDSFFAEESTNEDDRIRILDETEAVFDNFFLTDTESSTGAIVDWWEQHIINNNYNDASGAAQRFKAYRRDKIGSLDPKDYNDLATYVADSGAYFLYMFIGDKKIGSYNSSIRKRYRKELELFNYLCVQCKGVYDEATVYDLLYAGCTEHYKMTPEAKIQQLCKLGRNYSVGELAVILSIVSSIIGIIATLLSICSMVFQFVVTVPDDYEVGVPVEEDWDIAGARASNNKLKLPILLMGAVGLFMLFNKNK